MRGSDSLTAARPYTGPVKPSPHPPHPKPRPVGSVKYQDRTTPGAQVDISALSAQAITKHRRVSSTPKSEAYVPYRRFIQYDAFKESRTEALSRPSRTRLSQPKSGKASDMIKGSQYLAVTPYSKLSKRPTLSRKEDSEKPIDLRLSEGDEGKPVLGRRSTTFIVDSDNVFLDSSSLETLHRKIKSRHQARRNTTTLEKPDHLADSADTHSPDEALPTRTSTSKDVTSSVESQSEEVREPAGRGFHQCQTKKMSTRDGARNPVSEGSVPARPKSAGQLRYCETEDSDESSLDGEIEIVDIDKELENDPEPSPYWSQGQPLQVPEVFIQTNHSTDSLPRTSSSGRNGAKPSVAAGAPHHHQPQHKNLPIPHPHSSHSPLQQQKPQRPSRQRHGSGESDFSVFSDQVLKAPPSNQRRRFLSEPEIVGVEERVVGGSRPNGRARKGRGSDDSRPDPNNVTFPPKLVVPRGRERLYTDTMERVLSRYSDMGLREVSEDVSPKGRVSRHPVGHHVSGTAGHAPNISGARDPGSGYPFPPRKLKPILKPPRQNTENSSSM